MRLESDKALVDGLQAGDEAAVAELARRGWHNRCLLSKSCPALQHSS